MIGAITVEMLARECAEQLKKGNGSKIICISCDDEANGFHTLFFGFNDSINEVETVINYGMMHDKHDAKDVILLG